MKQPFILLEQSDSLGGLAKTIEWNDFGRHDLGPHKIFTSNKHLMNHIKSLLPAKNWLLQKKTSSIFVNKHHISYPPSPFSLLKIYGLFNFSKILTSYFFTKIRSLFKKHQAKTFEDDISNRIGNSLYKMLFKPLALKLWGDPKSLDIKLSESRIQTPKISELIGRLLKLKKTSKFEALYFSYPKNGLQTLWEKILLNAKNYGTFKLNHEVKKIIVENKTITEIHVQDLLSNTIHRYKIKQNDFIVSTIPIKKLTSALCGFLHNEDIIQINSTIQLNDLYLVFLKIDQQELIKESWIFIPNPDIIFHRLSEQSSFDPNMTPRGSIICCEIMDSPTRPIFNKNNIELINIVICDLHKMGYKNFNILSSKVICLSQSYPVYKTNFEFKLDQILRRFDELNNFRTIGRQGSFNYIGTLDAMDIGYGAAAWFEKYIDKNKTIAKLAWQKERTRTKTYPILD